MAHLIQIGFRIINLDAITDIEYDPLRITFWHGESKIERVECDDPCYEPLKEYLAALCKLRFEPSLVDESESE